MAAVEFRLRYSLPFCIRIPWADPGRVTYFKGRQTILATDKPGMAIWREKLFAMLLRNTQTPIAFFNLPPNRVVELGSQVEIHAAQFLV